MMNFIFCDYSIAIEKIDKESTEAMTASIALFLKPKNLVIFRLAEEGSLTLAKSLANGFLACGINIVDGGIATSPLASWFVTAHKIDSIVVGLDIKIYSRKQGLVNVKNGLREIKKSFFSPLTLVKTNKPKEGGLSRKSFTEKYQKYILHKTKTPKSNVRIAIDYLGGASNLLVNDVLEKLKIGFATINEGTSRAVSNSKLDLDDNKAHQQIKWMLENKRYNLGVVFARDGDRALFFNEKGETIPHACILSLLASYYLPASRDSKNIVANSKLGKVVPKAARLAGGNFYLSPAGRINIVDTMRQKRSLMGADHQGHYFFKELDYGNNPLLALLKILQILGEKKEPISKLVERLN